MTRWPARSPRWWSARETLATLLAAAGVGGHVLLEGPPGVAKTLLANAFARALGVEFRRVQFTPDMLPSDLTGTMTLRGGELAFRPGPVFTNVLLADEINRTPPKTQAALLEAMQERQVTVDGAPRAAAGPVPRRRHPEPDRVRGHLPAARGAARPLPGQARRRLPDRGGGAARCSALARRGVGAGDLDAGRGRWPSADGAARGAGAGRRHARRATRSPRYVVAVVRRTRELPSVELGASPRAAVHLLGAARAAARLAGPRLRDPRRRVADGRARCSATGSCSARGRARALPRRTTPSPTALGAVPVPRGDAPTPARPPRCSRVVALAAAAGRAAARRRCRRVALAGATLADALAVRAPAADRAAGGADPGARRRRAARRSRSTRRGPGAVRCASRPARPGARPARGGRRGSTRTLVAAAAAAATRCRRRRRAPTGRSASAAGTTGPARRTRCSSTPTCPRRAGSRSPCARAASASRAGGARAARARHRLRVDPRLRARRRRAPDQLAGHRRGSAGR